MELDKLPVAWLLELELFEVLDDDVQEEEEEVVAVDREFNALVSAVKDDSEVAFAVRMFSPSNGVVKVGDDDADVVTEAVVMPIKVVVTIVSMSGDDSAVSVVYVGVWDGAVVGVADPPPVDSFFSMLQLFSAGADDEPPRHGKQQRNSVDRNYAPHVHDESPYCWRSSCPSGGWRLYYCDGGLLVLAR